MSTLKYKALFTWSLIWTFLRALGFYLILTLPALKIPEIYVYSAGLVLCVSWIAGLLFVLLAWLVYAMPFSPRRKMIGLMAAVPLGVLVAFQFIQIIGAWNHIWQAGTYLVFPLIAIIAGLISTFLSRKRFSFFFNQSNIAPKHRK